MFSKFYSNAFTLIELLATLAVLVILLFLLSPIIFRLNDYLALNNEIEGLKTFIYQVQMQSRYQKQSYTLTTAQNEAQKKWCVIAVQKPDDKAIICDCLHLPSCQLKQTYFIYHNHYAESNIKNKSLYPKSFININGESAQLEAKCIKIRVHDLEQTLQFHKVGRIYVASENKRTTCKD